MGKKKKPKIEKVDVSSMSDVKKQEYCNSLLNEGKSIAQVARITGLDETYVSNARETYKKYLV